MVQNTGGTAQAPEKATPTRGVAVGTTAGVATLFLLLRLFAVSGGGTGTPPAPSLKPSTSATRSR